MSRGSRRERARRFDSTTVQQVEAPTSGGTRQVGALRFGQNESTLTIDAAKLEAPSRAYDADAAWIEHRSGNLSVLFAKKNRNEPGMLQSRLEVRYPIESFVNTFWNSSTQFFDKLSVYIATWPAEARQTDPPPTELRASQAHSEWASFTYIAHSGSAASVDFYHLSTSAIARFVSTRSIVGVRIQPVVRVQLSVFELHSLLVQARQAAQEILSYLPENHRQLFEDQSDDEKDE